MARTGANLKAYTKCIHAYIIAEQSEFLWDVEAHFYTYPLIIERETQGFQNEEMHYLAENVYS